MKITRKQLRRLIAEAKFTPRRPLDRDALQITLGIHPDQLKSDKTKAKLRNHPHYEEGKKDLFGFIEISNDNYNWDGSYGIHIDSAVDEGTKALERLFNSYGSGSRLGGNYGEFTSQHVELMLQDLFDLGYLAVNVDDVVLTTPEGDDWYFAT